MLVGVPCAPISTWPPVSPVTCTQCRHPPPHPNTSLLGHRAVTSHLPTLGAPCYVSPPSASKSLCFYCQCCNREAHRDTQVQGRLAGDCWSEDSQDLLDMKGSQSEEVGKPDESWHSSAVFKVDTLSCQKAAFLKEEP